MPSEATFDFLSETKIESADESRIVGEIERHYPEISDPTLTKVRKTPFYPDFVLVRIDFRHRGTPVHVWGLCRPATGLAHVIDPQGTVLDLVDRLAPVHLADRATAEQYVRLRFAFQRNRTLGRRIVLADMGKDDIRVVETDNGYLATLRIFDETKGRLTREGRIEVRLRSTEGVVSIRVVGAFRPAAEKALAALPPASEAPEVLRVATPYFVETWEKTWKTEPTAAVRPFDQPLTAREPVGEPYDSLLRGFGAQDAIDRKSVV
jgi:hypothetical protein